MKAQKLYDLQEQFGFVSGNGLHEFFAKACGEPSPAGAVEIDTDRAQGFIRSSLDRMARNNGGDLEGLYTADELCWLMSI